MELPTVQANEHASTNPSLQTASLETFRGDALQPIPAIFYAYAVPACVYRKLNAVVVVVKSAQDGA
jgi:hypothetical protein